MFKLWFLKCTYIKHVLQWSLSFIETEQSFWVSKHRYMYNVLYKTVVFVSLLQGLHLQNDWETEKHKLTLLKPNLIFEMWPEDKFTIKYFLKNAQDEIEGYQGRESFQRNMGTRQKPSKFPIQLFRYATYLVTEQPTTKATILWPLDPIPNKAGYMSSSTCPHTILPSRSMLLSMMWQDGGDRKVTTASVWSELPRKWLLQPMTVSDWRHFRVPC